MAENDKPDLDEAGATIISELERLAKENPEKTAHVLYDKDFNRRVLSRQDVWDKSRKFASILKRHGITKGDIVCNTLVNSPERIITCYGTMAAGAITMHGQVFRADGEDLINSLKESKCKAILIDPKDQVSACLVLDKIKYTDEKTGEIRYSGLPDLTQIVNIKTCGVNESERFINVVDEEKEMFVDESVSKDDMAAVFTTSGTTGFSKLVEHTHFTLMAKVEVKSPLLANYSIFNNQSMGWFGGFPYLYPRTACIRVSIDLALGAPTEKGPFIVKIFNQENFFIVCLLSRDLQIVLDAIDSGEKLKRLVPIVGTGGAPIHKGTMSAIGKLAKKVVTAYGGTEFGICTSLELTEKSQFKDMCAGMPSSSCEIKIWGEVEQDLSQGRGGAILVRSQYLFKGYLNNPTKTEAAFSEDGFYKTGDIGYFDESGQLFVLGRMADAISKAGFIHYPGWMEKLINTIPGIESNVVIGVPDPLHHEEICLCMKLSPGAELTVEEAHEHCKKLFLTDENAAMTPLPQHYLFFDHFITNSNGKVDRRLMREEACKRLNIKV